MALNTDITLILSETIGPVTGCKQNQRFD